MFDSAVLRRLDTGHANGPDVGLLAETLLYYGHVNVLLTQPDFGALLQAIGTDNMQRLAESRHCRLSLLKDSLGVTSTKSGLIVHDFVQFSMAGTDQEQAARGMSKDERLAIIYERSLGKSFDFRKAALAIQTHIEDTSLALGSANQDGITDAARDELGNPTYIKKSIEIALRGLVPGYEVNNSFKFDTLRLTKGFAVDTDLDFAAINRQYHTQVPSSHSSISSAYLLTQLLEANAEIYIAAKFQADLISPPRFAKAIQHKISDVIARRTQNFERIEHFQNLTLGSAPKIRELINSQPKKFGKFLDVLDNATRFKKWIKDLPPDQELACEYLKEVTAKNFLDHLPTKGVRYAMFGGIGIAVEVLIPSGIGIGASLALSASDTFLVDKLFGGWKPNQFIDSKLLPFIKGK
ncbi:MAG: hypothetical protein ACU0DI_14700 [Paracoccaceae bacterium]